MRISVFLLGVSLVSGPVIAPSQTRTATAKTEWNQATRAQLEAALPMRAPVEKERIETEMTSASGVTDSHGRTIAAVVLITAGYAAQGKYSHYLLTQVPLRVGNKILLAPGAYVVGWVRTDDGLVVHIYQAETGKDEGTVLARPAAQPVPVVPVKIWPPAERSMIQIGRFMFPYSPAD